MVKDMAMASIAAGADGLIVEVHPNPEDAFSDGDQSLLPEKFKALMQAASRVTEAVGRTI
jgi:3-deoxy-7-phosphoheptulonate synthase